MLMLFYSEDADLTFRIQIGRLRVEGARNNLNLLPLHELTSCQPSSLQPYSVTPRLRTSPAVRSIRTYHSSTLHLASIRLSDLLMFFGTKILPARVTVTSRRMT